MKRGMTAALLVTGLLSVIFSAGFFHRSDAPAEPCRPARPAIAREELEPHSDQVVWHGGYNAVANAPEQGGMLALTQSPNYRRAADLSLRVADCTKAEDDLESRLREIKGEILEMLMEGTEGSRTCTLSVLIPSNEFRSFVVEL